jgi:hypothetical protein
VPGAEWGHGLLRAQASPDDVEQLIERALTQVGHVRLGEGEEARAQVLLLEPASPAHLAAAARLHDTHPGLPIVCVSVLAPFPDALALRPLAYLVKPFSIAGLRATVASVLDGTGAPPSGSHRPPGR